MPSAERLTVATLNYELFRIKYIGRALVDLGIIGTAESYIQLIESNALLEDDNLDSYFLAQADFLSKVEDTFGQVDGYGLRFIIPHTIGLGKGDYTDENGLITLGAEAGTTNQIRFWKQCRTMSLNEENPGASTKEQEVTEVDHLVLGNAIDRLEEVNLLLRAEL